MADIELRNETELEFVDISSEIERTYHFPLLFNHEAHKNKEGHLWLTIHEPQWLSVSKSGGHRILTKSGNCYYIPPIWYFLQWKSKEGSPHFVK